MTTNAAIHIEAAPARRRLILALGRGKSGKTISARWLTEAMRARGVNPVVADADTAGTGLCRYEEGALRPSRNDGEKSWWDAVLADTCLTRPPSAFIIGWCGSFRFPTAMAVMPVSWRTC